MKIKALKFGVLVLVLAFPLSLAAQQSLGDLARHLREQREKSGKKPVKVYTNDNLPARPPGEGPTASSGMSAEAGTKPSTSSSSTEASAKAGETQESEKSSAEDKKKTKEYWQAKFKPLRAQLARAQEEQQVSEDELNLLQIELTRAIDPPAKADLEAKVQAKQNEVVEERTATEKVKKQLEDLQKEFDDSGAPADWSKTD